MSANESDSPGHLFRGVSDILVKGGASDGVPEPRRLAPVAAGVYNYTVRQSPGTALSR